MNTLVALQRSKWLAVIILFSACISAVSLRAQNDVTQNPSGSGSQYAGVGQPELSANRIIQILQDNPDLADTLRGAAAQNGITGTDQQFAQRLQTDQSLRIQVTRFLIDQGAVDPNDPELKNGQNTQNQPTGQNDQSGQTNQQGYPTGQANQGTRNQSNQNLPANQTNPNVRQQQPTSTTGGYQGAQGTGDQNQPGMTSPNENVLYPNPTETTREQESPDQIPVRHRKVPLAYRNIPAIRDLYLQVQDSNAQLQRFGVDLVSGNGTASSTPDVSAGDEYVIGPGDDLTVVVWGGLSREMRVSVDREGRIALPEVGTVMLAGKSLGEARQIIQSSLATQFHNIHSDVSLARVRFVRVYVVGDVARPGAYDVSALSTVLNAVSNAGGPTPKGSLRRIRHLRGEKLVAEIDLYDLLLKGVRGNIGGLAPGDTILVPPVGPQVTVAGMVRRPAIYELKQETDLPQVLDLAGGVLATGSLREIRVERVEAHERKVMLSLKLPQLKDPNKITTAVAGFKPQDGDRVLIGAIAPYSNQAVYLDGHVVHPGKYSFHDGMDVSELVGTYQDLMPEPSDHAEIIRLQPPEMRPKVLEFNLREVLEGTDPVKLQPFDTVRIYGRYEVDAPTVAIYGEVVKPGEYPMSNGMTAVELVRLAGGLKRSAYTETADLASYTVENNKKIEVDSRTVEIGRALKGDADTDVRLKPRDVLTIRQLAGWNTVGTVVKVNGEVNYPGTYGIVEGERLSSVLKRAGGFREDAYARGALLVRDEVRQINQKARDTLIARVENMVPDIRVEPSAAPAMLAAAQAQQDQMLRRLKATPPSGRQVIKITEDISKWENSPLDIELRPGDEITIPKYPTFVTVQGQVNSPSAITYVPGEKASWYFKRAGGSTPAAAMKDAFVIRADGSVVGRGSNSGFWSGSVMSTVMYPGDTVVIPEKIITGNSAWRGVLQTVQVMSQLAITAGVVASF